MLTWTPSVRMRFTEVRNRFLSRFQSGLQIRFVRGFFWSLIGTGVSQGANLLVSIISANLLGIVGFGELAILNNTWGVFSIFAGLGLGLTATKYVAELRDANPELAGELLGFLIGVTIFLGVAVSLMLWILAPPLAAQVLLASHLVTPLRLGVLLLFFNAVNGVEISALGGFEAFKEIAWILIARALLNLAAVTAGIWFFELQGAVGGMILAAALGWLLSYIARRKICQRKGIMIRYGLTRNGFRVLWNFSFPAFAGEMLIGQVTPVSWLTNTMLLNQPNGYTQVAIFNAAYQWRTLGLFFPNIVRQTIMPILSSLFGMRQHHRVRKVLLVGILLSFVTSLLAVFPLILLRDRVMMLYGAGFGGHGLVFGAVVIVIVLIAIQIPANQIFVATGRMHLVLLLNSLYTLVVLVGALLFVVQWNGGAFGLALSFLVSQTVLTLVTVVFAFPLARIETDTA